MIELILSGVSKLEDRNGQQRRSKKEESSMALFLVDVHWPPQDLGSKSAYSPSANYSANSAFQYASLINFDQLWYRVECCE